MGSSTDNRGVSGKVEISFAIPTDDPMRWLLRNGSVIFKKGATSGIEVRGGYIPYFKGKHGLTVTYYVFTSVMKREDGRNFADVTMMTCIDGRVMEVNDIAHDVEVVLPPDMAEALAASAVPRD